MNDDDMDEVDMTTVDDDDILANQVAAPAATTEPNTVSLLALINMLLSM